MSASLRFTSAKLPGVSDFWIGMRWLHLVAMAFFLGGRHDVANTLYELSLATGLGAMVLPPALYLSGALPAACLAAACFLAGDSKQGAKSKARTGGLFNFTHGDKRIQCIWKTNEGGNHHNHVHVGVRPA